MIYIAMKKLFIILLLPLFFACSDDDSADLGIIDYQTGQEYEQTFYISNVDANGKLYLQGINDQLRYAVAPSDDVFEQISPSDSTRPNVEETEEIKLYQVADLHFTFKERDNSTWQSIYNVERISDWRWVIGKKTRVLSIKSMPPQVYERIIIVSEVK